MHETTKDATLGGLWSGGVAPLGTSSKKLGMWLFIVSDTLTFSAVLLAYSYLRLANPDWPRPFEFYPAIIKSTGMTLVLLLSSLTMVLGVAAAHRNDRKATVKWLLATAVCGADVRHSAHDGMDRRCSTRATRPGAIRRACRCSARRSSAPPVCTCCTCPSA